MNLDQLKSDYWEQIAVDGKLKYKTPVDKILITYGIKTPHALKLLIIENQLGIFNRSCEFCEQDFYFNSRSEYSAKTSTGILGCGHRAFCEMCGHTPVINHLLCDSCYAIDSDNENRRLEAEESTAEIEDFNKIEQQALAYINENPGCLFDDDRFDLKRLSFALHCSLSKADEIYRSIRTKFGLVIRFSDRNIHFAGVNENLNIPAYENENSHSIIKSPLAQKMYFSLIEFFPYVFVEVPFIAFINLQKYDNQVDDQERRHLFNKRLDFVCCNENFEVVLLAEYNGQHHFSNNAQSIESRRFKRKMAELFGIEFIEVNSPSQISSKFKHLRG